MKKSVLYILVTLFTIFLTACQSTVHSSSVQQKQTPRHLVKEIAMEAEQGHVYKEPHFPIGSNVKDVIKAYGRPEQSGAEFLDYTNSHHLVFTITNNIVIQIASTNPQIQTLTKEDVTGEMGKPSQQGTTGNGVFDQYQVGHYLLKFYFMKNNLDEISVE